jgi:biotin transport system substrate-specific component
MFKANTLLGDRIWSPDSANRLTRGLVLSVAGSMFIAACARIQVPMWPVPITMLTFAVLFVGLVYGPRLAAATVSLYLAQGIAGLPVFAAGSGITYLMGPTGGYLLACLPAAFVAGTLAQHGWGTQAGRVFLAMLAGSFIFYLVGAGWLAGFVGPEKAIAAGVVPFLVGDALKAMLAAALLPAAWSLLPRDA